MAFIVFAFASAITLQETHALQPWVIVSSTDNSLSAKTFREKFSTV